MATVVTTNWIHNPYASTGTGSINAQTGVTKSQLTGLSIAHPLGGTIDKALRCTLGATFSGSNVAWWNRGAMSFAQGTPYVGHALVRGQGSAIGKQGNLWMFLAGGATGAIGPTASLVLDGTWQHIQVPFSIDTADRTALTPYLRLIGGANGDVIDCTAFQLEEGTEATGPIPLPSTGALDPEYAWLGTAHASPSTRTVEIAAASSRSFPVVKIGQSHVGPLRVGRR